MILISSTTEGLDINKWQCIVAEEATGATSKEGVYAGGDAVTGAATVILAMGAGKQAAAAIDKYNLAQTAFSTVMGTGLLKAKESADPCTAKEIDALLALTERYREAALEAGDTAMAEVLAHVPAYGARTFREALQALRILHWAVWAASCISLPVSANGNLKTVWPASASWPWRS